MAELATVSDIIRAEQDTDIAVKLGFSTTSCAARPPGDTVRR